MILLSIVYHTITLVKTEQIILEELNKHIENKDFSGYFNNDKISYKEIREILGNQDDYINKVVFKENKNLSENDSKITSSLNENILDSRSHSQCNENRYDDKDIQKDNQSISNRHIHVNVNLDCHICHKSQKTIKKIEEKIETMRNKHNSISINNQNQSIYSNKRQKIKNDFQQKNELSNRKIEQIVQKTSTYKINSTNNSKSNNSSSKIGDGNNSTCFSWCESGNTTKK